MAIDPIYKGKGKDTRSVLQKHLRDYTARHQFDYFIHKDLSSFLRRELDFYIKNEMMHLDDIEELTSPKAEEYLSKIRALRRCALPVIRMLAQLEDFQKKLWLKKKFVVETRYCITLDRVPEELYEEICVNDAQWAEWEQLYSISEIEQNLLTTKPRTAAFLSQHPHMMLDTRHFNREFTHRILAAINNLDEKLDGVCFHSDNFQALQLMQERYREQVNCIYIDPPYNTDAGPISYKNGYRSASWVSLLVDRLDVSSRMLAQTGVLCATIDDYQQKELHFLIEELFGRENIAGTVAIRINPSGRPVPSGFAQSHEYAIFAKKSSLAEIGKLPRTDLQMQRYRESDVDGFYMWELFRKRGSNSERADRPTLFYPIYYNGETIRVPIMTWDEHSKKWKVQEEPCLGETVLLPFDDNKVERTWRWQPESIKADPTQFRVKERDGVLTVYYKFRPNEEGVLPLTIWSDAKYSATEHGTGTLKKYFKDYNVFSYPKSIYAVIDCIALSGMRVPNTVCLDYFAGSGTTGHAVINLNRSKEDSSRKYILVEMGEYFDTVLVPRLKKVVYSTDWRDGKPQNRDTGISHSFKIIRLESYEDTLNNLRLQRTPEQTVVLQRADEDQRAEYMVGYFLNVESEGSASLLNVKQFRDPFNYQMQITTKSAGETKATRIDLVETFNWLLGLKVKNIDAQGAFLSVTGEQRTGGRTLIIWRTLSDDLEGDNTALEKYLSQQAFHPVDTKFDFIYVNGSHTLADPHKKIHLIEEAFQRRMFESNTSELLR